MPTAVEHTIIAVLKPFADGTDLSLDVTGLHIPEAAQHRSDHNNFALTGDGLHLDIQLFVPAVQHTDFLLG